MGILNQTADPELNRIIDEAAAKIKKAGKWLGTAAGDFPRWKERGVDWFAGISDWGAMAAGIRAFKAECDKVRGS
jgi:2-keto-3-deoxy-L-rhamnonate aldolase RhmA